MIETINACAPGTVIELGDQRVEPFNLRGAQFDPPITLRGGRFTCPSETDRCFRFDKCSGLHFEGGIVEGTDRTAGAILVDQGSNIAFRNMTFRGLKHGIAHRGVDGFEVSDCTFSDMRIDAIRGGGSSRVLIARNQATDFFPIATGGTGDHPDFIQFWPLHGYTDNDDITVIDNVFIRGDGLPVQGIFVRGDYPDRPCFGRVRVCGNRIEGGLRNGISVSGASGGEIAGNVIISHEDCLSALRISNYEGEVAGNTAKHFIGDVPVAKNTLANTAPDTEQKEPERIEITLEPGQTLIVTAA